VIPNPGLTLNEGAIEPWTKPQHEWAHDELKQFCKSEKIPLIVPFNQLSRQEQRAIVEGK
jgi:excinuclease ABC subunit A